jgi:hypothetical protein
MNSAENLVFKEDTCTNSDEISARAGRGGRENLRTCVTYHGLDSDIIENVICVAIIDDGAHARVDHHLEVRERRTHPVTSRGKLGIHVIIGADPCTL